MIRKVNITILRKKRKYLKYLILKALALLLTGDESKRDRKLDALYTHVSCCCFSTETRPREYSRFIVSRNKMFSRKEAE